MKQDSNLYCCGFNAMLYHWSYSSLLFATDFLIDPYFLIIEFTCYQTIFILLSLSQDSYLKPPSGFVTTVGVFAESKGFEPLHRINDDGLAGHYNTILTTLQKKSAEGEGLEPPNLLQSTVFKTAS